MQANELLQLARVNENQVEKKRQLNEALKVNKHFLLNSLISVDIKIMYIIYIKLKLIRKLVIKTESCLKSYLCLFKSLKMDNNKVEN